MITLGLEKLYERLQEIQEVGRRLEALRQEEFVLMERLETLAEEVDPTASTRRRRSDREDFLKIARTWRDGLHIAPEEAIALTREQLWDLPEEDMAWVIRELDLA
jgi:hypothetical protein